MLICIFLFPSFPSKYYLLGSNSGGDNFNMGPTLLNSDIKHLCGIKLLIKYYKSAFVNYYTENQGRCCRKVIRPQNTGTCKGLNNEFEQIQQNSYIFSQQKGRFCNISGFGHKAPFNNIFSLLKVKRVKYLTGIVSLNLKQKTLELHRPYLWPVTFLIPKSPHWCFTDWLSLDTLDL